MPYKSIKDLPVSIKGHLPEHAQKIFQEAFNHAWEQYKSPSKRKNNASREEIAFKVAWTAVKKKYHKDEKSNSWVES